ncbi:MAG: 50S ribosomal protein L32 [Candidatus Margulisbacteria bacterium]|nr:50S ribosomal protein L32 [Candidatus Margulisiibacteriota bacterium]
MPVPKKRHSNVRQGKRRFSNYRLKATAVSHCPDCGAPILSHHVCLSCGKYQGRQVIKIKQKKGKKEKA